MHLCTYLHLLLTCLRAFVLYVPKYLYVYMPLYFTYLRVFMFNLALCLRVYVPLLNCVPIWTAYVTSFLYILDAFVPVGLIFVPY